MVTASPDSRCVLNESCIDVYMYCILYMYMYSSIQYMYTVYMTVHVQRSLTVCFINVLGQ